MKRINRRVNRPICGELCGECDSLMTGRGDFAMWKFFFIFGNAEVLLDLLLYNNREIL